MAKNPSKKAAKRTGARIRNRVPANRVPANKGKRYPAEPLDKPEVHALLRECSTTAPTGIRNRAMIVMMYTTGLRIGELLALSTKDIGRHEDNGYAVRVLHGKGDRSRTVGVPDDAVEYVLRWMDVRKATPAIGPTSPLFCTLKGRPIFGAYVRSLLPRLGRAAGIAKRIHPHGLRHSYASALANKRIPLPTIQRALGHANIATTSRYLDHAMPAELIRITSALELL